MAFIDTIAENILWIINLAGGIFIIYVVLVILRWREYRFMKKTLAEVRDELKKINNKLTKKK